MICGIVRSYHAMLFLMLALLWPLCVAFVVQRPVGQYVTYKERTNTFLSSSTNNPILSSPRHNNVKPILAHPDLVSASSLLTADLTETVTNVLIGIGGVVVVFGLIVFVLAAYVIPTAVSQVEEMAKELDPELWREYEQKLNPGETLAARPELLQELGNKVLELQRKAQDDDSQWEASQRRAEVVITPEIVSEVRNTSTLTSEGLSSPSTEGSSNDIEVISKNKWDD